MGSPTTPPPTMLGSLPKNKIAEGKFIRGTQGEVL